MLIFNTTFHVDNSVFERYLTFIKETYIPLATRSGSLQSPSLSRIHANHGESGVSLALQFKAENIEILNQWADQIGDNLQKEIVKQFGDKVAGFPTLLEEIEL